MSSSSAVAWWAAASPAAGGIRGQFPTETEIRFSLDTEPSLERHARLESSEVVGLRDQDRYPIFRQPEGVEVAAIERDGARVRSVRAAQGTVQAPVVGIEVPVQSAGTPSPSGSRWSRCS